MAQVDLRIAAMKKIVQGNTSGGRGRVDDDEDEEIDWVGLEELLGDFNTKAVAVAVGGKTKGGAKGGTKGGIKGETKDETKGGTGAMEAERGEVEEGLPPRPQSAASHLNQGCNDPPPPLHSHKKNQQQPKVRGVEFLPDGRPLKRFPLSVSPPRPSRPGRAGNGEAHGEMGVGVVKPKAKPFGLGQQRRAAALLAARQVKLTD